MKWRLCSLQLEERERARLGSAAFLTLIKSRVTLQWKKHDEKQSLHELQAERGGGRGWCKGGGGGQRQTNRQLLTNSCTEHFTDREGEKRGNEGGKGERASTLVTKLESPHFSTVWKYGPHFMIQFPLPLFFPSLSNYPFPYHTLLLFFAAAVRVIKAC